MDSPTRKIAILGSTGSIGESTIGVVQALGSRFSVVGLSSHRRLDRLVQQATLLRPAWVVAADGESSKQFDWSGLPAGTRYATGAKALTELVRDPEIDLVVSAIVGSAGLDRKSTRLNSSH